MGRIEEYLGNSDEEGCGGEEKERKTEAEVHGHCNYGLEGDVSIEGGAKPGGVEATGHKHRLHIEVGKDVVEMEEDAD